MINAVALARADEDAPPVPATTQAGGLLNIIERVAMDQSIDIARLEMLMEMQRKIVADEARKIFFAAMSAAQQEMPSVVKDRENLHLKSKYAQLEAIDDAIRPVYTRHGFSLMFSQRPTENPGDIVIVCTVLHKAGHSITEELPGKIDTGPGRSANQAVGSSISYLRRYLTCMIFNVVVRNEDKDGHVPAGTSRTITASQKETLIDLMRSTNADTAKFLQYCGVETLDMLPHADYPRALGSLQRKLAEMEAR